MRFLEREWPLYPEHEKLASDPHWRNVFEESRIADLAKRLADDLNIEDRKGTSALVQYMLQQLFGGAVIGNRPFQPDTLDEVSAAARRVWALATEEINHHHLCVNFGSDRVRGMLGRLHKELSELTTFAQVAHVAPRRGRGDRRRYDLIAMLRIASIYWRQLTETEPTNIWHQGQPVSPFARFCAAVVEYGDPSSLANLSTAMKHWKKEEQQELRNPALPFSEKDHEGG